ncbi:MAG: hypothetical protein ACE5GA_03960, partial [Candidatus Zixiibacteriota bacterium]
GAVSRSGSSLGSQIRFAGSSPVYTLNGATLGTDPAHYGMFSLLPTEALDRLSYSDHATSARGGSPTKVELYTDRSFRDASEARITLSALEAVVGARRGNGRFFIAGSVRGSILDKLVERLSDTTAPVRIPPTEFRDLFVNAGIRLSGSLELFVDQYFTSDGLTLTTGATSLNGDGIRASQNTGRSLLNLELRKLTPGLWWKVAAQAERVTADYRAQVAGEAGPAALALDLSERRRRFQLSGEITRMWKTLRIAAGAQGVWREYPSTYLRQQNWNFLPPQATSDNPNFYQLGLNLLYSEFDVAASGGELALYAEIEKELPRWTLRAGARAQMYGYLAHRYDVVGRLSVSHKLNRYAGLKVGYGSYAESPLGNLIDPYQTLIRRQLAELNSLKTNLITIAYERNYRERSVFGARLFAKRITDLPALTPIIRTYEAFGLALNALGDLRMRSSRSQDYVGGALSYRRRRALEGLFGDRLDFSFSYALTMARESVRGISASPTENAPHQLETGLDYRAGKLWSLGARLSARSGYRYTSPRDFDLSPSGLLQTYTGELDGESIASENNARFPAHASLQISARYEREVFSLFASVGNLLNRSNPIISARDGFIYDSGILPSIGASWRF